MSKARYFDSFNDAIAEAHRRRRARKHPTSFEVLRYRNMDTKRITFRVIEQGTFRSSMWPVRYNLQVAMRVKADGYEIPLRIQVDGESVYVPRAEAA